MNKSQRPPCYLCGAEGYIEPGSLYLPNVDATFQIFLCLRCLDPQIMQAERIIQKLPGPIPSQVPHYDSPFKRLQAQYQLSSQLIEPKVLLLPETSNNPDKPNSFRNCEFCKKPIELKSARDRLKTFCNRKCSAMHLRSATSTKSFQTKRNTKQPENIPVQSTEL